MYPTPQFCVCSEFSFSSQKWEGGGGGRGGNSEAAKIIESGRGGEGLARYFPVSEKNYERPFVITRLKLSTE